MFYSIHDRDCSNSGGRAWRRQSVGLRWSLWRESVQSRGNLKIVSDLCQRGPQRAGRGLLAQERRRGPEGPQCRAERPSRSGRVPGDQRGPGLGPLREYTLAGRGPGDPRLPPF